MTDYKTLSCSFCGKRRYQVKKIVMGTGPHICICNQCIDLCAAMLDEDCVPQTGSVAALADDLRRACENPKQLLGDGSRVVLRVDLVLAIADGLAAIGVDL